MSIDTPPSPPTADALIASAKGLQDNEIQALVARIVVDSLGRPWDPLKHPRDSKGRFIETFAEIRGAFRTPGGAVGEPQIAGRVVGINQDGSVLVRIDHGAGEYAGREGEYVTLPGNDIEALETKAKIARAINDEERAKINSLADEIAPIDSNAAEALRRAADPANTDMMAQLADLHEARDLLDDNEDDAVSPKVRDLVWDLSDTLGDSPSNEENIKVAQAIIRDHLPADLTTEQRQEAIARLDAALTQPPQRQAPALTEGLDGFAANLHRLADRQMQAGFPADAVHIRNVAAKVSDAAAEPDAEKRDALLEQAASGALRVKNRNLQKQIVKTIKDARGAVAARENAPAPDPNAPKARIAEPPSAAQPLPPISSVNIPPPPAAPNVPMNVTDFQRKTLIEWARSEHGADAGAAMEELLDGKTSLDDPRLADAMAELRSDKMGADLDRAAAARGGKNDVRGVNRRAQYLKSARNAFLRETAAPAEPAPAAPDAPEAPPAPEARIPSSPKIDYIDPEPPVRPKGMGSRTTFDRVDQAVGLIPPLSPGTEITVGGKKYIVQDAHSSIGGQNWVRVEGPDGVRVWSARLAPGARPGGRQIVVDKPYEGIGEPIQPLPKADLPEKAGQYEAYIKAQQDAVQGPQQQQNAPGPTLVGRLIEMAKAGGFTFDPRTKTFKTDGYAVARQGMGAEPFPADAPDGFARLAAYVADNWDTFEADPGAFLGGWEQDGLIYLDVPDVLDSLEDAIKAGTDRFEIAIADLAKYAAGEDGEIRLQYATRPPVGTPAHNDWTDLNGVRHVNEPDTAGPDAPGAGGDEGAVHTAPGEGPGDRGPGGPAGPGDWPAVDDNGNPVPEGWVPELPDDPSQHGLAKDGYTVYAKDGQYRVIPPYDPDDNWEVTVPSWEAVDAVIEEHKDFLAKRGVPTNRRAEAAKMMERLGFGQDVLDAVNEGKTADEVRAALAADPRFRELYDGYKSAIAAPSLMNRKQAEDFRLWEQLQMVAMLQLEINDIIERRPSLPKTAPEVPAYSGELRDVKLRDLAEVYGAARNAQAWLGDDMNGLAIYDPMPEYMPLRQREARAEAETNRRQELQDTWANFAALVRDRKFVEAQQELDRIESFHRDEGMNPEFVQEHQAFIDQARGALDKIQQRGVDQPQLEIPGVAPLSPPNRIEQDNPALNAAFADQIENDPDTNAKMKALIERMNELHTVLQGEGDDYALAFDAQVMDIILALDNEDYANAFDRIDALFFSPPTEKETTDGFENAEPKIGDYFGADQAYEALRDGKDAWNALMDEIDLQEQQGAFDEDPVHDVLLPFIVRLPQEKFSASGLRALFDLRDGRTPDLQNLAALRDDLQMQYNAADPGDRNQEALGNAYRQVNAMVREREAAEIPAPDAAPGDAIIAEPRDGESFLRRRAEDAVAALDDQLGDYAGELYNAVIQDEQLTSYDEIRDAIVHLRERLDFEIGDKDAVDIIDKVMDEYHIDNPYKPVIDKALRGEPLASWERALLGDPEVPVPDVVPDPPKDGEPIPEERRKIDPRIRGLVEEVRRGIGLPELPDRIDIDRNGAIVRPLDLVWVPRAGNQGPQGEDVVKRPEGVAQIHRIYQKGGRTYADVIMYDPEYVDLKNRNKAKRDGGLKNNDPFWHFDVKISDIQKLADGNPDADEFLKHLGPEERRQYAGRNAGRLAQDRGRVRAEMARMADLQYIGDRMPDDMNGLPVGRGDVVTYNGKKWEVVHVGLPDAKGDVRLELAPVGANGEVIPEKGPDGALLPGGKRAQPLARNVEFYDQPLGDRLPGVTVDELREFLARLDKAKYPVGTDLQAAVATADLDRIRRAVDADPAIADYIADWTAYWADYRDRLLKANLAGRFDAIRPNEQEMIRKDKNDLVNIMAAREGRFLEGVGADRHIKRVVPEAGPPRVYEGKRPDVLLAMNYRDVRELIQVMVDTDTGDATLKELKRLHEDLGVINLDNDDNYLKAWDLSARMEDMANAHGLPDLVDQIHAMRLVMRDWKADQDKRKIIRQGGPGNMPNIPAGHTVAPGLIREPGLSRKAPPAPDAADLPPEMVEAFRDVVANPNARNRERVAAFYDNHDGKYNTAQRQAAAYRLGDVYDILGDKGVAQAWYDAGDELDAPKPDLELLDIKRPSDLIMGDVIVVPKGHGMLLQEHPGAGRWKVEAITPPGRDGEPWAFLLGDEANPADLGKWVYLHPDVKIDVARPEAPAAPEPGPENYAQVGFWDAAELDAIKNLMNDPHMGGWDGKDADADVWRAIYMGGPVDAAKFDDLRARIEAWAGPNYWMVKSMDRYVGAKRPAPAAGRPATPARPAPMPADVADDLLRMGDRFISPEAKNAVRALKAGDAPDPADLDALKRDVAARIDHYDRNPGNPGRREFYQGVADYLDGLGAGRGAAGDIIEPGNAIDRVNVAFEARYDELRADRKNNAARENAKNVNRVGDEIVELLDEAQAYHRDGDKDTRDTYMSRVDDAINKIRTDNPELADSVQNWAEGVRRYFAQEDLRGLLRDYFDKAQSFHDMDTPNPGERDRYLKAAQDVIDGRRETFPALADEMQAELDRLRAQYEADDLERARAKPQGRTEALESFDDQVDALRKRLRAAGDRAAAADLVDRAQDVAKALNDAEEAHKKGDTASRDEALDMAREAIPALEDIDADIAEAARQAVEGNAARFAREDAPAGAVSSGNLADLGTIDPARTDLNVPESKEKGDMEDVAHQLIALGLTKRDVYEIARGRKPAPPGMEMKPWGNGCLGGAVRVKVKGKGGRNRYYLIKSDGISPLGLEAEEDTAILYRALGFDQPRVYRLRAENDGNDIILMDWATQAAGVKKAQQFDDIWPNRYYFPDVSDLHIADPKQLLAMLLSNGVLGQTDRHPQNIMWGEDSNGVGHVIFIDNGLMWWNGSYRRVGNNSDRTNEKSPWLANPLAIMMNAAPNRQHNDNRLIGAAQEVIRGMSEDEAVSFITAWAERMRREADAREKEFRNTGAARWVRIRTQWLIDNAEDVARALRSGQIPDEHFAEYESVY